MNKPLNRATAGITTTNPVRVVQFGEGNFLRAFVDWIIQTMNEKTDFKSDVQVVQPIGPGMGEIINAQQGLYHVVLKGIRNGNPITETKLVTCVRGVLNPYEDFAAFKALGENPDLQFILSNTTEAGIAFDPADSGYDILPKSFPGKVALLLHHRFQHVKGSPEKGLVIMPCELIDKNGTKLREIVLKYADLWNLSDEFRKWVEHHNTFCNTLVDRIVPGFPKDDIAEIQQAVGFSDNLVVMAEPFHLWVIEGPDHVKKLFPADQAGLDVKFVKDQAPYRTRKVRILNGAHTSLVPVAYLAGLRTVRDSIDDAVIGKFIREAIDEEIIPTLDLPLDELKAFARDVVERFQNPFIRHELASIALNSVSKYKVRVLPSVLEYVKRKGRLPERLTYSLACLIQFYKGSWNGETLPVNDSADILAFFADAWKQKDLRQVVSAVLGNKHFWDSDLNDVPGLTGKITADLEKLAAEQTVSV